MPIYLTLCTDVSISIAKDGSIISVLAPSKLRIRPPGICNVLILTLAIIDGAPVNVCVDLVNWVMKIVVIIVLMDISAVFNLLILVSNLGISCLTMLFLFFSSGCFPYLTSWICYELNGKRPWQHASRGNALNDNQ